jgi:hypothetical protein
MKSSDLALDLIGCIGAVGTAEMQQAQAQDPVRWEAYDPDGYYCEIQGRGADAGVALIRKRIAGMSVAELRRRAELAERELLNLGITWVLG